MSRSLQCRPYRKNNNRSKHRALPTKPIRNRPIDKRAKPGRQQKRRHKPALEAAVEIDARESRRKVFHLQHPRHDALVVAKEESAQRGELERAV